MEDEQRPGPIEIAFVGDLTDNEAELTDKLLSIEPGGECTLYFGSFAPAVAPIALCRWYR